MAAFIIPAVRLDLVLQTPDEALAFVAALPPADRAEVSPDWIARVRNSKPGDPWALSYTMIERTSGTAVGVCAFKAPPDAAGMVEIAYGVDPPHQSRGFATEAAAALVEFAFASGRVQLVRAHTLRERNIASERVLTKSGFLYVGDFVEPEDGLVCRWERRKSD